MNSLNKIMTQKERELLLKDLSARLLYGVIVYPIDCGKAILIGIKDGGLLLFDTIRKKEYDKPWDVEYIKPYFRPMSSMTKKEQDRYDILVDETIYRPGVLNCSNLINFCYEHHLDNLDLIEKGLALEAPKDMYDLNK